MLFNTSSILETVENKVVEFDENSEHSQQKQHMYALVLNEDSAITMKCSRVFKGPVVHFSRDDDLIYDITIRPLDPSVLVTAAVLTLGGGVIGHGTVSSNLDYNRPTSSNMFNRVFDSVVKFNQYPDFIHSIPIAGLMYYSVAITLIGDGDNDTEYIVEYNRTLLQTNTRNALMDLRDHLLHD